jgi:hypothetical protein
MRGYSLTEIITWIVGVFLGAVWLSRIFVVWLNRNSVVDISAAEYAVATKTPTPPTGGGAGTQSITVHCLG